MSKCDLCFKEDPCEYFYKWPDAGPNGEDVDGFCCKDCAKLEPIAQWEKLKDSLVSVKK